MNTFRQKKKKKESLFFYGLIYKIGKIILVFFSQKHINFIKFELIFVSQQNITQNYV